MQNAQLQWPTKLDDWNAMAIDFNQRIEAMGFTPRNGKSLRKKWQVLCSAKQPAEGEELTEQERRAKAINARGPMGQGQTRPLDGPAEEDDSRKRVKLDGGEGGGAAESEPASSPLAPVLPHLAPLPPLPMAMGENAALVAEMHALLASREKTREQQVAMFEEWSRRDEQERQKFERLMQGLAARNASQPDAPTQHTQPQLPLPPSPPPQQPPPQQQQQDNNLNGGGKQ